jgi:hypothetical protein
MDRSGQSTSNYNWDILGGDAVGVLAATFGTGAIGRDAHADRAPPALKVDAFVLRRGRIFGKHRRSRQDCEHAEYRKECSTRSQGIAIRNDSAAIARDSPPVAHWFPRKAIVNISVGQDDQ